MRVKTARYMFCNCSQGLDTSQPVLLVLDGAKALHAATKRDWGQNGAIQRCQVHKKRNVKAHVPEKHHAELERRLSKAYHETGHETAKATLEATARWLAGADQPGCGFEPPGGIGGDAGGDPAGPGGGVASDVGHDQSHRGGPLGDAAGDGPRDALA
jgi:hypothetical protein